MVAEVKREDAKGEGIQEATSTLDIGSETKPMTIPGYCFLLLLVPALCVYINTIR